MQNNNIISVNVLVKNEVLILRKTKIICTLGSAVDTDCMVRELIAYSFGYQGAGDKIKRF